MKLWKHALFALAVLATVLLIQLGGKPDGRKVPAEDVAGADHGASPAGVPFAGARIRKAQRLLASAGEKDAREVLEELREALFSLPPAEAVAAIEAALADPSLDAPTGLEFDVGPGGRLKSQSSLRVALLDWLGQIDLVEAGRISRAILTTPTHADEWALALRNVSRAEPDEEGRVYVTAKAEELIRNGEWQAEQAVGYFESFDVLVHVRATESTGLLTELVTDTSSEGRACAHAAYLTLDRLMIREPVAMMQEFAKEPRLAKTRGRMVSNIVARGDLRESEQRQLVRAYLLDPKRTPDELASFAGVFPNNNYSISHNLLTTTTPPTGAQLRAHDAAALAIVESWLADPAFQPVHGTLTTMHRRLSTFVGQAGN